MPPAHASAVARNFSQMWHAAVWSLKLTCQGEGGNTGSVWWQPRCWWSWWCYCHRWWYCRGCWWCCSWWRRRVTAQSSWSSTWGKFMSLSKWMEDIWYMYMYIYIYVNIHTHTWFWQSHENPTPLWNKFVAVLPSTFAVIVMSCCLLDKMPQIPSKSNVLSLLLCRRRVDGSLGTNKSTKGDRVWWATGEIAIMHNSSDNISQDLQCMIMHYTYSSWVLNLHSKSTFKNIIEL